MSYLEFNPTELAQKLRSADANISPEWGTMNLHQMIEHLGEVFDVSMGIRVEKQITPEEKIERFQKFLMSENPMPREYKATFIREETYGSVNPSIEEAIDWLESKMNAFTEYYTSNPDQKNLHPEFGMLNHDMWIWLHRKHITHHFQQFKLA